FFFASFQGSHQRGGPSPRSMTVPDALQRAGNYSQSGKAIIDPNTKNPFPNNTIPQSRFDSIAVGLLKLVPLPNNGGNSLWLSAAAHRDHHPRLGEGG